ncbi:MAG: tetratricopeptide repeat protein [Coraliomargaritaceae bacterium]
MHREPKKPKNPLLPDDDQGNASKTVDASNLELSAEERITSYWEKNKSSIIGAIIISTIAIIGVQGYKLAEEKAKLKIQNAYEEAKLNDSLESFIETHSETVLGGFAALELANRAYEDSEYSVALEFYTAAEKALGNSPLKDKARIGIAFARYQIDSEDGLSALDSLFADTTILESVRAEAGYVLLVDAKSKGDEAKVKAFAESINALDNAGSWKFRISQFL